MNDTTTSPAATAHDRLAQDLRAVIADAEALLQETMREAGNGYSEARERLETTLHGARTRLAAAERAAVEGISRAGRAADAYVHENPWPMIGAGAGVGLLLGLLIGRR